MEQMYSIVAGVEDYSEFVPWCSGSRVFGRQPGNFKCKMTIGFPPVQESYTSIVTVVKPHLVRVRIHYTWTDSANFNHSSVDPLLR